MKLNSLLIISLSLMASVTFAADRTGKALLTKCSAELAQDPALGDSKDPESAWQNLEQKETQGMKFTPKCDKAEDRYERIHHPDTWKAEEAKEKENK